MASSSSSSLKIDSIGLLGGSLIGNSVEFTHVANQLGSVFVQRKIDLVHGSSPLGLIDKVALKASLGGCKVTVIVIAAIRKFLDGNLGDKIEVPSIQDRIPKLLESADAFIALPGGLSTFEDILHIASWLALSIHSKPIGLLNINGYYDMFLIFLDHAVREGFMSGSTRQLLVADSDPEGLIEKLHAFESPPSSVVSEIDWFGNRRKKRKIDFNLPPSP